MLLCMDCGGTILREDTPGPPEGTLSHGLCLGCYARRFTDVTQERLDDLIEPSLELLPRGSLVLDGDLRVIGYNSNESRLSGLTAPSVLGKRFFDEVAPCLAAREVGDWCAENVHATDMRRREVEWVLQLRSGTRSVTICLLAGLGRVSVTRDMSAVERVSAAARRG